MTALLISSLILLADTTVFGPTPHSVIVEAQHTGEEAFYADPEYYFRNVLLKRWPERNLYHFCGMARYWEGDHPLKEAVKHCQSFMCEDL